MTPSHIHLSPRDWVLLVLVLLLQAALYHTVFVRELSWHMPQNFDQAGMLFLSYDLENLVLTKGIRELWVELGSNWHMNGLLMPVEGAISGLIFGGGRLARLMVNFFALAGMEVMVFVTILRFCRRRDLAIAALGLILCQNIPWEDAGGLLDFRLDFMAYCLYGIWACAVLCSGMFQDRRWAVISGIVGGFLVLNRFIVVTYLAGVTFGFLVLCLIHLLLRQRSNDDALAHWKRIGNVGLSLAILLAISLPVLFLNRNSIFMYYGIGHLLGDERLFRAHEQGLFSLMDHLTYYPHTLLTQHLGGFFGLAVGVVVMGILAAWRNPPGLFAKARSDQGDVLLFLAGAVIGPLIVLTLDISKSSVVGGIVGIPLILLLVVTASFVQASKLLPQTRMAFAILGLGLGCSFSHAFHHLPYYSAKDDLLRMIQLDLDMARLADENQWSKPRISVDRIHPWFADAAISDVIFEQTGRLMMFRTELSNRIRAFSREEMLTRLGVSDFVVLTTSPKPGLYPFNDSLLANQDELTRWVQSNTSLFRHISFADFEADVYARPGVRIEGIDGGWVLSRGFHVLTKGSAASSFPSIVVTFPTPPGQLSVDTKFTAKLETASGLQTIPAHFERDQQSATLILDLSGVRSDLPEAVKIHVLPDHSFIPKDLGINNDTRQLVIPGPIDVRMLHSINERVIP